MTTKTLISCALAFLLFLAPYSDDAQAETLTMAVVSSQPYISTAGQQYQFSCRSDGKCSATPTPSTEYVTTFFDGHFQLVLKTKQRYFQDLWYDIERECSPTNQCVYTSIEISEYQSVETLAILEITQGEQRRVLNILNGGRD